MRRHLRTLIVALLISAAAHAQAAPRFKAVAFDNFVIFNPNSVAPEVEKAFPGKGTEFTKAWRAKQFEYGFLRSIRTPRGPPSPTSRAACCAPTPKVPASSTSSMSFSAPSERHLQTRPACLSAWHGAACVKQGGDRLCGVWRLGCIWRQELRLPHLLGEQVQPAAPRAGNCAGCHLERYFGPAALRPWRRRRGKVSSGGSTPTPLPIVSP